MPPSKGEKIKLSIAVFLVACVMVGVGWRLVSLHLSAVASPKAYEFHRVIPGLRGTIYDRNAQQCPLARSIPIWDYHIDPLAVNMRRHKRNDVAKTVADALGLPYRTVRDKFGRIDSRYVPLAISSDDAAHSIITDPKKVSGISVEDKQERRYPNERLLSHVIGFVTRDPTNSVGGAGIEQKYEKFLKGKSGFIAGEKDALGMELVERRKIDSPPMRGHDIHLTIDRNIQAEVEAALAEGLVNCEGEAGWAVVMAVKTGEILAMATLPDYEPARFNKFNDDMRRNRTIAVNYEPGSVMKTITACAAINERKLGPETTYNTNRNDPQYYRLPGDGSHVWPERMSVRDALVHSSNIVFGKIGVDIGPKVLWSYMDAFGFGRKTGIELPGEETGILPKYRQWDKVKYSRAPIGQGVSVTAIQLVAAYAAIGNGGVLMKPYVISKIIDAKGKVVTETKPTVIGQPIRATTADKVIDMLKGVATKDGTARRAAVPGYSVAGKTGTAQMPNPSGHGYSQTDFRGSFVGLVPATHPELAILVTYQKGTRKGYRNQGGVCAAPVFSRIASMALRYLEVEPDFPEQLGEDE